MTLFALSANGLIVEATVDTDRDDCWSKAFQFFCNNGVGNLLATSCDGMENEVGSGKVHPRKSRYFERRFWKQPLESRRYVRRWGYRIIEVEVAAIGSRVRDIPFNPTDDDLRAFWRRAGGGFHGPHIETGTMPEAKLLPLLRKLAR